jgi:hypothetical protein
MPRLLAFILFVQALLIGGAVHARDKHLELVVTRPYLEMHTGPGRG